MAHFLLIYDLAEDYMDRREAFRAEHLALAGAAADAGELLLGGALTGPSDTALLVFTTAERAEAFARSDPYVAEGLVRRFSIREWQTVVGSAASEPLGQGLA
ncbi:YciI-like protein [Parvularcula oceani]|uniref:YciI-like protein n=1 Tax=Parvularcula oceani TaxID=1247963 RepID=UPI0004E27664|nr:YciI-like protein [Parvularcula oceani]